METRSRIESEQEVKAYIQDLKFALNNGARIDFQARRKVDEKREERYTNQYTVEAFISEWEPIRGIEKRTVDTFCGRIYENGKRSRFPGRKEMREFGKVYNGKDDVYIKIRVELFGMYGNATTFVMSFHFAEKPFTAEMFPYRR